MRNSYNIIFSIILSPKYSILHSENSERLCASDGEAAQIWILSRRRLRYISRNYYVMFSCK